MTSHIDDLIAKLAQSSSVPYEDSRAAIAALGRHGQPAIDPLLVALRGGKHYPYKIVEALVAIGNAPISNDIIHALEKKEYAGWRSSILQCLEASCETWTIAPLVWGLKDNEKNTRLLSVWFLLSLDRRNPESHQQVKEALDAFGGSQYGDVKYDDLRNLMDFASENTIIREAAIQRWAMAGPSHFALLKDILEVDHSFSHLKYWRDDEMYRNYPQLALDTIAEAIGMSGKLGVELLIDSLSSTFHNKIEAAIRGLIKAGPVVLGRLHALLNHWAIIEVVGGIGNESSIEPLQRLLQGCRRDLSYGLLVARALRKIADKNESVQSSVAASLGKFAGNPAAPVEYRDVRLLGYLHLKDVTTFRDPEIKDEQMQRAAVEAWVSVENPNTQLLCDELNDSRSVQQAIVEVLVRLEVPDVKALYGHKKDATSLDASHMDLLIGALQKRDDEIRETAITALIRIGKDAIYPLYKLLTNDRYVAWDASKENELQMFVAADVLARIGGRRATDALVRAVVRGGGGWGNRVSQAASEGLVKIGAPAIAPLLFVVKYGEPRDARSVEFYLEKLLETNSIVEALVERKKSKRAMDALFDFLGNQEAHLKVIRNRQSIAICNAEVTLSAIDVTEESPTSLQLFDFLETQRSDLICVIIRVLEAIKDNRAIEPLRLLVKSNREEVRQAATKALETLWIDALYRTEN